MSLTRSPFLQTRTQGGAGDLVIANAAFAPGNVFFVQSANSNAGDSAGKGQTPDAPFATIDFAIGQCTADQGDLIIVLPGHVETITAAAGVALDVAGVTILGVGQGRQRPKVNFTTAAAASFNVSAARCAVRGLWFKNAIDAQTAMINVSAADFVFEDNEVELADATTQATLGILTTASADRLRIEANHFHGTTDAGVTAVISLVGGDSIVIRNNTVFGAHSTSGSIFNQTTACTGLILDGNRIVNLTADGNNKAINVHASTTGLIVNNRIAIIDSTSPAPVTAAAMYVSGNYTIGAVGVGSASTLL